MAYHTKTRTYKNDQINEFAVAREWSKYHTPRNLVLALVGEMGELAELLQWDGDSENDNNDDSNDDSTIIGNSKDDEKTTIKLSQEIADCTIYAIRIATVCGGDVVSQIQQQLLLSCKV